MLTLTLQSGRNRRGSQAQLADALRNGESFRNSTGSLQGFGVAPGPNIHMGRLHLRDYPSITSAVYVVYSYATPIAWQCRNGDWVTVDQRFSATTSRHQHAIRVALAEVQA
jgi:hypothetical protein